MWIFLLIPSTLIILIWVFIKQKNQSQPSPVQSYTKQAQLTSITSLSPTYLIPSVSLPNPPAQTTYITEVSDSLISLLKSHSFLGIDTEESRCNSYKGKICLIQISTPSHNFIIDTLPNRHTISQLQQIFSDPSITKIFHGCQNDTQWLQRDFGILCVNVFDTQIAAKYLKMNKLGLNSLWEKYCEFQMSAEYKKLMQVSDWQQRPLSKEQVEYAAMDSFYLIYLMKVMIQDLDDDLVLRIRKETNKVCVEPYEFKVTLDYCARLYKENIDKVPNPKLLQIFFNLIKFFNTLAATENKQLEALIPLSSVVSLTNALPTTINDLKLLKLPSNLIKNYNEILEIINSSQPAETPSKSKQITILRAQQKQERYKNFLKKYTITGQVFENCQIQLPNGEILCYSNQKKVKWYLDRNLASTISTTPMIIRLNFEPNFRSDLDEKDRKLFKNEKKNECVVCGSAQSFLRYRVVPLMYRQYFPEDFKHLCRHDVLLLCAPCHERVNKCSETFKRAIATELSIPLQSQCFGGKFKDQLVGMRKICVSLKKNKDKIPENRKIELIRQINEFCIKYDQVFKGLEMETEEQKIEVLSSNEKIREINEISREVDWKNEEIDTHGKMVMDQITDVKGFVLRWKLNFIEKMQPQCLPGSWQELLPNN